ncbi:MAG TPA: hypothetical protein VJC18_07830 [bacterium]|nr:hypothetical protein [bacterium]
MVFWRRPLIKFLSSLKLGVFLLLALIMLAAWGTFIESRMGALYAKRFLYLSPGFVFLEALLFLNVLMAMLVRLPPRKKLCGFYLAHAGVLLLLAGAGMTGIWGLDGSLTL